METETRNIKRLHFALEKTGRVKRVTDDRVMNRFEMNANLMCPACFWIYFKKSVFARFPNHFITRECFAQPPLRSWLCAAETEISARASDVEVDNAPLLLWHTVDECEIRLLHFPVVKCIAQELVRRRVLR